MLGVVLMNDKTHMVLMEVVSQPLDQYKNNGLISNLIKILFGKIWICCIVWFLVNHGFMIFSKSWKWYGIY